MLYLAVGGEFGATPTQIEDEWSAEQFILMLDALIDRREIQEEEMENAERGGSSSGYKKKINNVSDLEMIAFLSGG